MIGLAAGTRVRRKVGSIATLLMERADTKLVAAQRAKNERSIQHAALHPAPAKSRVKVSLGAKKQKEV